MNSRQRARRCCRWSTRHLERTTDRQVSQPTPTRNRRPLPRVVGCWRRRSRNQRQWVRVRSGENAGDPDLLHPGAASRWRRCDPARPRHWHGAVDGGARAGGGLQEQRDVRIAPAAWRPAVRPAWAPSTPPLPDPSAASPPLRRRRPDDPSARGPLRGQRLDGQTVAAGCRNPSAAARRSQPGTHPRGALPAVPGRRADHHADWRALRGQPADRPPLVAGCRGRVAAPRPLTKGQHRSPLTCPRHRTLRMSGRPGAGRARAGRSGAL